MKRTRFSAGTLFATGLTIVMIYAGCGQKSELTSVRFVPPVLPLVEMRNQQGGFAGNEACKECHAKAFQEHAHSRHAITMRPAEIGVLGALAVPQGIIPPTGDYRSSQADGILNFEALRGRGSTKLKADVVLGSGKSGMTYVGQMNATSITEFRMSYMPRSNNWFLTPGQEGSDDLDIGSVSTYDAARKCVLCHAVTVPEGSLRPERKFMGVGCESCHGPSSAHIAAAKTKGAKNLQIEKMSQWSAEKLNDLCGKCHRTSSDVSLMTRDAGSTARFQPYGLSISPCYLKSNQTLSCSSCHAPHSDAVTNNAAYERACLNCHSTAPQPPIPHITPPSVRKSCPINPRTGCIPCHMPQRKIFPGTKLNVTMADHLILAYGKKRTER